MPIKNVPWVSGQDPNQIGEDHDTNQWVAQAPWWYQNYPDSGYETPGFRWVALVAKGAALFGNARQLNRADVIIPYTTGASIPNASNEFYIRCVRKAGAAVAFSNTNRPGEDLDNATASHPVHNHTYDVSPDSDNQLKSFVRSAGPLIAELLQLTITDISQADPGVVTYTGADPVNGVTMRLSGVGGMTEVNGNNYVVANVDTGANTFELQGVNTTGFTAYTSGGIAEEHLQNLALVCATTSSDSYYVRAASATRQQWRLLFVFDDMDITIVDDDDEIADAVTAILNGVGFAEDQQTASVIFSNVDDEFDASAVTQTVNTWTDTALTINSPDLTGITGTGYAFVNTESVSIITNVTNATTAVVTYTGDRPQEGQSVRIANVSGMTELNANLYTANNVGATTFELEGINSTGFGTYSGDTVGEAFGGHRMSRGHPFAVVVGGENHIVQPPAGVATFVAAVPDMLVSNRVDVPAGVADFVTAPPTVLVSNRVDVPAGVATFATLIPTLFRPSALSVTITDEADVARPNLTALRVSIWDAQPTGVNVAPDQVATGETTDGAGLLEMFLTFEPSGGTVWVCIADTTGAQQTPPAEVTAG